MIINSIQMNMFKLIIIRKIIMGNLSILTDKIRSYIKTDPEVLHYFQTQQNCQYPKQFARKCLQNMFDIGDFGNFNSLKKIHRYMHPALRYIQYCKSTAQNALPNGSSDQNFIRIHQQQLISSANNVMLIYYQFLRKVVPTNISYFHFMREKDFYIQYNALRYVLQAGQAGTLFKSTSKTVNVFNRLKTDNKLLYVKFISHWLYDMVKYKCSAIYLQSQTLAYLIVVNAVILCGLLESQKINILEQYERREKNSAIKIQIYQHCLYSFIYILSQSHVDKKAKTQQGNGYMQIILLGVSNILRTMWGHDKQSKQSIKQTTKTMYCPSYWYVKQIGFIKNPTLETVCFLLLVDIVYKMNKNISQLSSQQNPDSISNLKQQQKSKSKKQRFPNLQQVYQNKQSQVKLDDYQNRNSINSEDIHNLVSNQILKRKPTQDYFVNTAINSTTHIVLYNCIITILQQFPHFAKFLDLQKMLICEINSIQPNSFIRPFVLKIIRSIVESNTQDKNQQPTNFQTQSHRTTADFQQGKIHPLLVEYSKNNQMSYSTQHLIIPEQTVGKNCGVFLTRNFGKFLQNYSKQIEISNGQIWRQILKYNIHEMQQISK